jgi:hypothetical protein
VGSSLALGGCQDQPAGTVSGKVSYRGKPVTTGSVNFYAPEKGVGATAELDSSGAFTIKEPLDAGNYKVYFLPPPPQQLPPGQKARQVTFGVPRKYQDASSTPLSREVKTGENEFPLELD